jgi:predicted ATPase
LRGTRTGTRLVIIATVRTPAPGKAKPPIHRLLGRLPEGLLVHRRLQPLSPPQISEWLADRFRDEQACATLVHTLFSVTGGQPGPIHELLAQLREKGALHEDGEYWGTDELALASIADGTADSAVDLGGLSNTTSDLLHAASVFGDEFDGLALARLLGIDELTVEDELAPAVRQGVIQIVGTITKDDGDVATHYRFASSTLRAALLRHLDRDRRHALQAKLAGGPDGAAGSAQARSNASSTSDSVH